ncbi:MAG: calcium-binding protein [Microcoleaceae cyanobacterium]
MATIKPDQAREERIDAEIIVDAYTEEEQVLGWYYYLQQKMGFPFKAKWLIPSSPEGKEVEVVSMSPEEECIHEMYVQVLYHDPSSEDVFSARLAEIQPVEVDANTIEAIADWHYWVEMDYAFG